MRQVRFPLKIKLLTLMIVLIASSLIIYVSIALKTFREDKSAYIFETMLNKASSEKIILSQKLGDGAFEVSNSSLSFNQNDPSGILKDHFGKETAYDVKIAVPVQNIFFEWKNQLTPMNEAEEKLLQTI